MDPLRDGVRAGQVSVLSYEPALEELRRVLGYPMLKLSTERQTQIVAQYQAQVDMVLMPAGFSMESQLTPSGFPRCRDPDDQHFLALAFHTHADALVSRDKALLKLRHRARKFAVTVLDVPEMIALLQRHPFTIAAKQDLIAVTATAS
jgi:predicted nucleic acid-binding protein